MALCGQVWILDVACNLCQTSRPLAKKDENGCILSPSALSVGAGVKRDRMDEAGLIDAASLRLRPFLLHTEMPHMALKIAVLASGNGSNLQAILDKHAAGVLDVDIRLVLCNKRNAYALERAGAVGVPTLCLPHTDYPDRESFDRAMIRAIQESGADTIVLAGYMRLLTSTFLQAFAGRVINIHPAILPAFAGVRGAADALEYGVKLAGCTVHFVDEIMDHGPVIIQAAVPVNPEEDVETLKQRIHGAEHRVYPQALQWLAENRLSLEGRVVRLAPSDKPKLAAAGNCLVWPPLEEGF